MNEIVKNCHALGLVLFKSIVLILLNSLGTKKKESILVGPDLTSTFTGQSFVVTRVIKLSINNHVSPHSQENNNCYFIKYYKKQKKKDYLMQYMANLLLSYSTILTEEQVKTLFFKYISHGTRLSKLVMFLRIDS